MSARSGCFEGSSELSVLERDLVRKRELDLRVDKLFCVWSSGLGSRDGIQRDDLDVLGSNSVLSGHIVN